MSTAFYLQTNDGRYLYPTSGTWGPSYLSGPIANAYAFVDDWYAQDAIRSWGSPLKRVPVPWTRIKPPKCDACHKRRAVWGHPIVGIRCNECHKAETT